LSFPVSLCQRERIVPFSSFIRGKSKSIFAKADRRKIPLFDKEGLREICLFNGKSK